MALADFQRQSAVMFQQLGVLEKAEPLFRRALAGKEETLVAIHPETLTAVGDLGSLLHDQGKLAEAEPLLQRALVGLEETLGANHPDTLLTVDNLGSLLRDQGKLAEAEPLYRRALAGCEQTLGANHRNTLFTRGNLGALAIAKGGPHVSRRAVEDVLRVLMDPPHSLTCKHPMVRKFEQVLAGEPNPNPS